MSEYEKIRRSVIRSFMWSLAYDLSKTAGDDYKLPLFKKIVAMQAVASITKIMLNECQMYCTDKEVIEEMKMKAWNALAEKYLEQEVVLNIPTAIETIYMNEFDWMSKIPNLDRNINYMVFLAIDETVKPKVSRIVTDEYGDILSKVIYEYMKEKK